MTTSRSIRFFLEFFEVPHQWDRDYSQYLWEHPGSFVQIEHILNHAHRYTPLNDIRPRLVTNYEYSSKPPYGPKATHHRLYWLFYQDWHRDSHHRIYSSSEFKWDDTCMTALDFDQRAHHQYRMNYIYKPRDKVEEMVNYLQHLGPYDLDILLKLRIPDLIRGEVETP